MTNIELYEALKKDLSEDSARMIAEIVPPAANVATKADIARIDARFGELELSLEKRFTQLERRMLQMSLVFVVPLWGALVAGLVKYVAEL